MRSEAAADLLLNLPHTKVTLRLVIIEGNGEVAHERQHFITVFVQAKEQAANWALLGTSLLPRRLGRRISRIASLKDCLITGGEAVLFSGMQTLTPTLLRQIDLALDLAEELPHLLGPGLLVLFFESRQFTKVVGIAEGMPAAEFCVDGQAVMEGSAVELRKNADGFQCDAPSLGVCGLVGKSGSARHMQPVEFARNPHSGFIEMGDLGVAESFVDAALHLRQDIGGALCYVLQGPFANRGAEEILHQLAHARKGQQLEVHQIRRQSLEAGTILKAVLDRLGERGRIVVVSLGAAARVGLVLGPLDL